MAGNYLRFLKMEFKVSRYFIGSCKIFLQVSKFQKIYGGNL